MLAHLVPILFLRWFLSLITSIESQVFIISLTIRKLLPVWVILQHLASILGNARRLLLHILAHRLTAAMRNKVARIWLLPLRQDNLTVLIVLDFANARKHDQRVWRQFLEVGCFAEQQDFKHQFHSHLRKNSRNEVCFRYLQRVNVIWGRLQILTVFA